MDYINFEKRLRSIVTTSDIYNHLESLPAVKPERRELLLTAVQNGFTLSDALSLYAQNQLTQEVVWAAISQRMQDNSSEIQA